MTIRTTISVTVNGEKRDIASSRLDALLRELVRLTDPGEAA